MTTMNGHHSSYKMKCPNDGCSAIILDSQLGTHLVTECEFRQRTCDLCMEDYVLIDEEVSYTPYFRKYEYFIRIEVSRINLVISII